MIYNWFHALRNTEKAAGFMMSSSGFTHVKDKDSIVLYSFQLKTQGGGSETETQRRRVL